MASLRKELAALRNLSSVADLILSTAELPWAAHYHGIASATEDEMHFCYTLGDFRIGELP
ncbi:MAG: hypothetical protein ABSE53_05850 [Terracidiphilus sp.]|jgi:hypothetical protein